MTTDDKLHTLATLFKAKDAAKEYFEDRHSAADKFAAFDINGHYNQRIINEIKKLADTFNQPPSGGS